MTSKPKIYIDGHVGTTGLRIREWLAGRADIDVLTIPEAYRKDAAARREYILSSDITVLCLPDEAAREAASWLQGSSTRLLDASSAHRVAGGWIYGLAELAPEQRTAIRAAQLVSNPGCYASAFILLVRPLVDVGLLAANTPIAIHGLSGYSGGGRALIERWEDPHGGLVGLPYEAPYALDRFHKHIPEMQTYTGLRQEPQFLPAVGPFRCGMRVQVPVHASLLLGTAEQAWEALQQRYAGEPFVTVHPLPAAGSINERSFDPQACNDTNRIELHVTPHPSGHLLLTAILDNLGKGASGAAIQNLNIMLGLPEQAGLPA